MNGGEGERVDVWMLPNLRRVQRWQFGAISHWRCRHVTLGTLPDGRWVVDHTDPRIGGHIYPNEQEARTAAGRLMADGEWFEIPANYGADGQPVGSDWVRRGGQWRRES